MHMCFKIKKSMVFERILWRNGWQIIEPTKHIVVLVANRVASRSGHRSGRQSGRRVQLGDPVSWIWRRRLRMRPGFKNDA